MQHHIQAEKDLFIILVGYSQIFKSWVTRSAK